ncbi:MAG: YceI family protein [Gallionella sp.]|uniref:YceI family protein n=2 Tax=Acidithiobacillus ferriphilus TaxID=1689834 RepID=UPI001C072240|nr:YceI family protein [Acidithiobacillus ferriphilus]MBU2829175.1 polyisoprenoid-binding protein [Acidithiobacillus ferriphilus]MDD4965290.1 YceI family protein [Gallionella sp.]
MLKRYPSSTLAVTALSLVMAGSAMATPIKHYTLLSGNPDGTYRIDPQHTNVLFTIGHVGITQFTGRFDKIAGSYTFNAQNPGKDRVQITIPATRINTGYALRDVHLRSKEFFDVKKYPDITFVSSKYVPNGKDMGDLYGNLTLHGITKPVVFQVRELGAGNVSYLPKPWGGYLSGFVATTTIHRSDFGIGAYLPEGLSNAVSIKVEVEGVKK